MSNNKKNLNNLNNTEKLTLKYMSNDTYNNLNNLNNKNISNLECIKDDIIDYKRNILKTTKTIFKLLEQDKSINLPDNILYSFEKYCDNLVNHIKHIKTKNIVQDELNSYENTYSNNISDNSNNIDAIIYNNKDNNNNIENFVKLVKIDKQVRKIIPRKKNI